MIPMLPVLGVMVGMRTPPALRALLVAAADRCRPVVCPSVEPLPDPPPAAFLWCASSASPPGQARHAAWVGTLTDLNHPVVRAAEVLLCETYDVLDAAGGRGVYVPDMPRGDDARPMTPFVRRRLRTARGLPDVVIARSEDDTWYWNDSPVALPADLVPTAAGSASAVVATGSGLPTALAWAAPTVTDPDSAASLHAVDGVHVLVAADPEERMRQARLLAGDDRLAARLGRAGRLMVLDRTDARHAAWTMLASLGLPTHPLAGSMSTLEHALDVLGTPEYSPVRLGARALADPLPRRPSVEGAR